MAIVRAIAMISVVRAVAMLLFVPLPLSCCSWYCHAIVRAIAMASSCHAAIVRTLIMLLFALLSYCCSCYCYVAVRAFAMDSCSCHAVARALAMLLFVLLPCYCSWYCHHIVRQSCLTPSFLHGRGTVRDRNPRKWEKEGDYTQHYIVTIRMISALRWTAMKTILTFYLLPRTQSQLQSNATVSVHTPQLYKVKLLVLTLSAPQQWPGTARCLLVTSDPATPPALVTRHWPMSFGYFWPPQH